MSHDPDPPVGHASPAPPRYRSKPDIAYQHIRRAILAGELEAGMPLDQDVLARELGMSRMPIRGALQRLSQEGLISTAPHHSAVVASITVDDVRDTYLVWTVLEAFATNLSAVQHNGSVGPRLHEIHNVLEAASHAGDAVTWVRLNKEFHVLLHAECGSRRLMHLLDGFWDDSLRFLTIYSQVARGRTEPSVNEHERLLQAYEQHDGPLAAQLITEHLTTTRDQLIDHLLTVETGGCGPVSDGQRTRLVTG